MKRFFPILVAALEGFAELINPSVLRGDAFVEQSNGHWDVHVSDQTLIDWDKFSLSEFETAQFHQPSTFSVVVNRCLSEKSEVLGKILANGHLVLVNPNGVYFGENSWVDAAKFTASTYDLFEDGFSGDKLCFEKDSRGEISAFGKIIAREGDILLLSRDVTYYSDDLLAPKGEVCVGEAYLKKEGEYGWIRVKPKIGIDVQGTIRANQVTLISGGDMFDLAINHEGLIEANTIAFEEGKVLFKGDQGNIVVSGKIETGCGGEVSLLGKEIEVTDSARLTAPEGNVFIGGGFQGKDAEKPNADIVLVKGAIDVSGDNGGEAILWSEKRTDFTGHINARGEAGDGGLIEVSSRGMLNYRGSVSAAAPNGTAGSLLLDPSSIVIGPAPSVPAFPTTPPGDYDPLVAAATLSSAEVAIVLGTGTDVIIQTASGAGGTGDITLLAGTANDILWSTGANLSIVADGNITILANLGHDPLMVMMPPSGMIQLVADNDLFIGPPAIGDRSLLQTTGMVDLKARNGDITVEAGTIMQYDSGVFSCAFYDVRCLGDLTIISNSNGNAVIQSNLTANPSVVSCGGNLSLISTANGSATLHSTTAPANIVVGGNLILDQQGTDNSGIDIGLPGATSNILVGGNMSMTRTSTGFMSIQASGDTNIIVGGAINMDDSGPMAPFFGILNDSGNLVVNAGGDITCSVANPNMFNGIIGQFDVDIISGGSLTSNNASLGAFGNFYIQCDYNCFLNGSTALTLFGAGTSLTIVVDNAFPAPPGIGMAGFVLEAGAAISSPGSSSPIQIFTARQILNTISGTINGVNFSGGILYVDTDQEHWGIYYPDGFVNPNSPFFTIFYKDTPALLTALAQPVFMFDISRYLHPYDEYISLANRFSERYFEGENYQPTAFQPYFLRKRTLRYTSFTMDRDNIEYSFIY